MTVSDERIGAARAADAEPRVLSAPLSGRKGRRWLACLRDLLFPPQCAACGAETGETGGTGALCPACFAECRFLTGPACRSCARPEPRLSAPDPDYICDACQALPPAWDRGVAVARYGGPIRTLLLRLKRADRLDTVPMLGAWAYRVARPLLADADLIVPVPLHWTRRLSRRFNQSAEIARALRATAQEAGGPVPSLDPGALRRIRCTPSQSGSFAERRANLDGAIVARPGLDLSGKRVLLIDDVLTSGATLDVAARALRKAGAEGVDACVIALAGSRDEPYVRAIPRDGEEADVPLLTPTVNQTSSAPSSQTASVGAPAAAGPTKGAP